MVQFGVRWIVAPRAGAHAGLLLYVLPKHLDEKVAALHLEQIGAKLTKLTKEQANNHYRY